MSTTEALIPGSVLGFRQFRVDVQGQLLPLHVGNQPWHSGTTLAVCANHPEHRPPVDGCTCGLHAWHHAEDALARDDDSSVVAAVRAHGRILLGMHGLRAERAEVLAVCLPTRWTSPRREAVTARLRTARPEVEIFTTARAFRRRFPAEQLAALGVRTRPTAHSRLPRAVHLPWAVGVVALYSVMVWPPALERAVTAGGWVGLLGGFVAWQAWLVWQSMDDDA
jgi:hypothetical protein